MKRSLTKRRSMHPRIPRPTQLSNEKKGSWLFRVCNSSRSASRSTSSSNGTSSTNGAISWSLQVDSDFDVSNEEKPWLLGYIGDYTTQLCRDYKDPY